jgi:hypothetical protein
MSDRPSRLRSVPSGIGIDRRAARAHLAGVVAADLALDLAAPLRAASDRLALSVDLIDRHVASSTGPAPYPWRALGALRQDLAASYLDATVAARRIDDLRGVLLALERLPGVESVNEAVEVGVHLAGHRLIDTVELLVDLTPIPHGLIERGGLALIVARAVMLCAESAAATVGSALSVRTSVDGGAGDQRILVAVSDNGRGTGGVLEAATLMAAVAEDWGATIDAAVEDEQGCAFEVWIKPAA